MIQRKLKVSDLGKNFGYRKRFKSKIVRSGVVLKNAFSGQPRRTWRELLTYTLARAQRSHFYNISVLKELFYLDTFQNKKVRGVKRLEPKMFFNVSQFQFKKKQKERSKKYELNRLLSLHVVGFFERTHQKNFIKKF